jgi:hypothetical protein
VYAVIEYIKDNVVRYFKPTEEKSNCSLNGKAAQWQVCFASFNHLLFGKSHQKEKAIVDCAKSIGLHGFIMYGTPGIVAVEGWMNDVQDFLSEVTLD